MNTSTRRIASIDILRGADMFFLSGGAALLYSFLLWCNGGSLPPAVCYQFGHAAWGGSFSCWDLVMPLFIFICGASMPFAFSKYYQLNGQKWKLATLLRVLRRVLLLFVLGMLVQGHLASADPARMKLFCNTLQAIGMGYLISAVVLLCFRKPLSWLLCCLGCMAAYWAAMRFIPYAGQPGGLFLPNNNLALYIDRSLQGHWADGTPYTWILTSLSFGALTLMGVLCGYVLKRWHGTKALGILGAAALLCLGGALLLELDTPLIKHIYSSSMVLWSGGLCIALLALFHLLFDLCPLAAKPAFPLRVIGCNALLSYLLTNTPGLGGQSIWNNLCAPQLQGVAALAGDASRWLYQLLAFSLLWLLLYYLYRKGSFLRV